jgi:ornithine cyclodeaminase
MPVLLTEADVRAVLSMDALIDVMEAALVQFSTGGVQQPLRAVLEPATGAFLGVMPAVIAEPAAVGTKIVTVYGSNSARGLPTHLATILLQDPETGALQAILDGRYITEARRAAVSAASARWLARDDARVMAVIGSGVQARSHIAALTRVRRLEEIRIWGRTPAHVAALVDEMQPSIGPTLSPARTIEEASSGADIVVLVTASSDPVLPRAWVRDGAHICAVGACRPTQREMDTALVTGARVFVDSRAGALAEAGDLVIPIREGAMEPSHVAGELGDVFAGRVQGRTADAEITIFKSLGMAVEDVAAARLAWQCASVRGLGRGFVL